MTSWVRLWADMPNDPKWRVIARRAGRPVSEVIAVFVHMMTNAGAARERGSLEAWTDEDVAMAIDAATEHVAAIREAMQGKTLDGDALTGWSKRQPKREDGGADRAKEWRDAKRTQPNASERTNPDDERKRTQANAAERPEEKREDEIDTSSLRSDGADAPPAADPIDEDPKAVLFDAGLKWLSEAQRKPENSLRPLVGKMLRDMGGDAYAAQLLGIFRDAKRERKADPVGWIQGVIKTRGARAGPATSPNRRNNGLEIAREEHAKRNHSEPVQQFASPDVGDDEVWSRYAKPALAAGG